MSIRQKTILIIGVTLIGLIGLLYASSRSILLQRFHNLEESSVRRNVQRAHSALDADLDALARVAAEWAARDDAAAFVQRPGDTYIATHLGDTTFAGLRLNAVVFLTAAGEIAYSAGYDLTSDARRPVPAGLLDQLAEGAPLRELLQTGRPVRGILSVPDGPLLLAAYPVGTGATPTGTLIFGRALSQREVERLAQEFDVLMTLHPLDTPTLPDDVRAVQSGLVAGRGIAVEPLDSHVVAGYTLLDDLFGQPALILKTSLSRDIYEQGQVSIWYFMLALVSSGVVVGIMIMLLLEQAVLSRLRQLSASVTRIGASSDPSIRVRMRGRDEVARLGRSVDGMLEALEQSQTSVREQRQMAEALRDTAAALTGTLNLDEVLERILTNVGHVVAHDAANIMLVENGHVSVARSRGYAGRGLGRWIAELRLSIAATPLVQQVVTSGEPVILPEVRVPDDWLPFEETRWVHSGLSAPICLEGEVIGLLNLESATPGFFTQQHAEWLDTFADQAALAIQNARFYEAERRERRLAQTLRTTAEALASSINLTETLELIIEQLAQVVRYDRAVVMLVEGNMLHPAGARGFAPEDKIFEAAYCYPQIPLFRDAMRTERLALRSDPDKDPRGIELPGFRASTRTWIGVPLVAHSIIIGFLSVSNDKPDAYSPADLEAVSAFAQQAALAIENARILTELESSVTELREAQAHLMRTTRLSAAGQIAAGVAHQINNPLTTIVAESHLMLQAMDPANPDAESLEAIRTSAHRAGAVVRRLLDLTRTHPYEMRPLDVNASLQSSVAIIRAQVTPHTARLDVELAPDLPPISGSMHHLEDVWINLLLNARDALSATEGGIITVRSALTASGDGICVTVQDNGPGIAPDALAHIFEPFFTTKDYGTGLGLSICQEIITYHKGTLRVDSTPGQGTTLTVTLPVTEQTE